jgi:hypothetical protein
MLHNIFMLDIMVNTCICKRSLGIHETKRRHTVLVVPALSRYFDDVHVKTSSMYKLCVTVTL